MKRYLIWLAALIVLAGSVSATTETMLTDYRLFLPADSVWVVRADNGARVDSVKWSTVTTIDTTFSIPNDTRTDIYFFAFGDGYATNGSPMLYTYDNHNTNAGGMMVPSDTNISGDTIATQGTDQAFRLKSLTVTNTTGDAVTFAGGIAGGDPVPGDGLVLTSNYNGDGLVATGYGTGVDIRGDITGTLTGNVTGNITGNLGGNVGGSITGDLNGNVTSIANAVITTSTFAAGALNNNVFATDAFTASKFHSDLTGTTGEIQAGVWGASVRLLSSNLMYLSSSEYTEIADSVWGINNATYGRQLTRFDEDSTTLDLNATTIGTVIGITNDVSLADADMALIGDTVWNKTFTTLFTAGSIGDSLSTVGYVQGSATMTAEEIMDSLFNRLVSDTSTGTFMAELFHNAQIGGDSASWASLTDVWRNQDTTHIDSSAIGNWIENNSGAAAASNWADAQRDSVLNVIADAGKLGQMLDSIFAIIDTVQNQDDWIAAATNLTLVIDTVNGIIDSVQLYDTRFDSLLAALSDAAMGDKVWIDPGARTLSSYIWNTTQRDSVLNTIKDANKANFMADISTLSTFDESTDSVIVNVTSAITTGGLVSKMEDSVHALTSDYKATGFSTLSKGDVADTTYKKFTDGSNEDQFKATGFATTTDSMLLANRGQIAAQVEDSVHTNTADYKADVSAIATDVANLDGWTPPDSFVIDISSALTAGLADSIADEVWNEDTASHNVAASYGVLTKDTSAFQGDASGLTAVAVADSVWGKAFTHAFTAGSMGDSVSTAGYVQGSASGLSAATIADTLTGRDSSLYSEGYWHKIANRSDSGSASGGSDTTAIRTMMENENFARNTDSLLLKSRAQIANQIADSTKNDSTAYHGAGSDTVAVLAMMNAENFAKNTDSLLLANRGQIAGQIEDSTHTNAADYKATGYSSHSVGDVYAEFISGSNEDAFKATGFLSASDSVLLANRAQIAAQFEDSVHGQAADYMATGYSAHSALDVYNTFIAGTNEQVFWVNTDNVADAVWDEDSTGHYTAGLMAFEASKTAATALTESGIADAVWDEVQSGHTSSGTFGANLDVAVSSIAGLSGPGPYTIDVQVLDTGATVDSAVTQGKVYVNNLAQNISGGPYQADLNNNGVATLQLPNGTWVMFITYPGFAPKLDTFTVSSAATDTLMVYRDAGAQTTVAWQLDKPNGLPYASAKVSINLVQMYPDDSILYVADTSLPAILSRELIATANADGLMSINLWPNPTLVGDSSWYEIFARASTGNNPITRKFKYRIPASDTTVWIQDLTRWRD